MGYAPAPALEVKDTRYVGNFSAGQLAMRDAAYETQYDEAAKQEDMMQRRTDILRSITESKANERVHRFQEKLRARGGTDSEGYPLYPVSYTHLTLPTKA